MPQHVKPTSFLIAKTAVCPEGVARWLAHIGVDDAALQEIENEILNGTVPDPALLVALAAKRCYKSFQPGLNPNVTKVRRNYIEYIDNILASGHGSVLEHSVYTFALEDVSRVFTAEMNRHRAGMAISEGSMRFIRFDKDIPYWVPTSIQPDHMSDDTDLSVRKARTRAVFNEVFEFVEDRYGELLGIWDMDEGDKNFAYKKQVTSCLRRIVPMGVASGGVWTGNLRAWRHIIAMRCSPAAEEEIRFVISQVFETLVKENELCFGDFDYDSDGFLYPKYPKV